MFKSIWDEFEVDGFWFQPDGERCHGRLHYSGERGAVLSLAGDVAGNGANRFSDHAVKAPVIWGESAKGESFTLLGGWRNRYSWQSGFNESQYRCRAVLRGVHERDPDAMKIAAVSARLSHLLPWVSSADAGPFLGKDGTISVTRVRVPYLMGRLESRHAKIVVSQQSQFSGDTNGYFHASVDLAALVTIEFESAVSLDEATRTLFAFRSFLMVCADDYVSIDWLEVVIDRPLEGGHRTVGTGTPVFMPLVGGRADMRNVTVDRLPLPLSQLGSSPCDVVDGWLAACESKKEVVDLLSGSQVRGAGATLEYGFLIMAQAMEGYARVRWPGGLVAEDVYLGLCATLKGVLPEDLDSDLRIKMESMLQYGNEASLRRRLRGASEHAREMGVGIPDELLGKAFINRVVNARNSLAHCSGSPEARNWKAMYGDAVLLRLILTVCLLEDVGVPAGGISRVAESVVARVP